MNVGAGNVSVKTAGGKTGNKQVDLEELVGNNAEERNWKGIGIALLVILIVCSLVVTAVILVTPTSDDVKVGEKFRYQDVFDAEFQPKSFSSKWIDKETLVYRNGQGALVALNVATNSSYELMDNTTFRQLDTDIYSVSADLQFVLVAHNVKKVNRHTKESLYKIYDRSNGKLLTLPLDKSSVNTPLQYASWAPTGRSLVYIEKNNIFYQVDPYKSANQLTFTGEEGVISNGVPDWLYEEEILLSDHALWWSPQGNLICYATFNDSKVPKYKYPYYGDTKDPVGGAFKSINYPKAGYIGPDGSPAVNPTVTLHVVNVAPRSDNTGAELQPPEVITKTGDYYLTAVSWKDSTRLAVIWMNRAWNMSVISICNAGNRNCMVNHREMVKDKKGWVKLSPPPFFTPSGDKYFMVLPERDGSNGDYDHVAMVTATSNDEGHRTYLSSGLWDVTEIVGYDPEKEYVYFIGTNGDPRKRHLMSVGTPTSDRPRIMTCMTCNQTVGCEYVSASFSPDAKYYVLHCLGPDVPSYVVKNTKNSDEYVVEDNAGPRAKLDTMATPKIEYHQIKIGSGYTAWLKLAIPPDLNKAHVRKYPTILFMYNGPESQKCNDRFMLDWATYLSASQGVIYGVMDGRGTGYRGSRFLHEIHKKFGTVEVDDQIKAVEYLRTLSYVDKYNIGIWGPSYGGFVAAHIARRGTGMVKCAMAVAPVTDFRYYDTAYTEKYMGVPTREDNYIGYDNANLNKKEEAEGFKKTRLLLVHGTGDDNVHFENSAHLIKTLTAAGADFQTQIYPDERHSFYDEPAKTHLYRTMTNFMMDCFNSTKVDWIETVDKSKKRKKSKQEGEEGQLKQYIKKKPPNLSFQLGSLKEANP
ncbi:inactive dipeptidyl peptidase 10-like isoform X2 [Lineus longissimus]|uniref:inactive dipeptidyl peptidase 10-like isoform X2 n=1 Tax=Lineus longissimus TaxID=88925 RepID=UPI00315C78EA